MRKTVLLLLSLLAFSSVVKADLVVRDAGTSPLVFTEQILPLDRQGKVEPIGDAFGQIKHVLAEAESILDQQGTGLDRAARMHFYVASSEVEKEAQKLVEKLYPDTPTTWVVTPLPQAEALIGMDVITPAGEVSIAAKETAILPSGVRYFISGQAAREKELAAATRGTMEQLQTTLRHFGRELADAVQVKSFLLPMSDVAVARKEIESFFPDGSVPPLVFVEWESSLPIEIELVAGGGEAKEAAEPIEYLTPEGMKASPVFCRVTRVNDAPLLYLSGLDGDSSLDPHEQVKQMFGSLQSALSANGSDLRHLAKATYYVANAEVSKALNDLRPDYYDPERPPAASKAMVAGGGQGAFITLDMIAVASSKQ